MMIPTPISEKAKNKARSGFTLVELLVAITLFSIAISIGIGGFVRALRTQRELISLIAANSNVSLAIEQMAREMRTGRDFTCLDGANDCSALQFVNAEDETVSYSLSAEGTLERQAGPTPSAVTADNVRIRHLSFFLFDNGSAPARITISMGVGVRNPELQENITNLQTTISSRSL